MNGRGVWQWVATSSLGLAMAFLTLWQSQLVRQVDAVQRAHEDCLAQTRRLDQQVAGVVTSREYLDRHAMEITRRIEALERKIDEYFRRGPLP
jgi:hypothetical protein